MNYQSFKGRTIDFTQQVEIYKNLHNGLWSVRQNGLVVAHLESFSMKRFTFKVSESIRQKVIAHKRKLVHATIVGYLVRVNHMQDFSDEQIQSFDDMYDNFRLTYNPYKSGNFYTTLKGEVHFYFPCNKEQTAYEIHANRRFINIK